MKTFIAFVLMISCTVAANLLMKTGASAGGATYLDKFLNWRVLIGLGFFGSAALAYIFILSRIPLNVAQSYAALQFVAVILASSLILNEPISWPQWCGIALTAGGVALIGWVR